MWLKGDIALIAELIYRLRNEEEDAFSVICELYGCITDDMKENCEALAVADEMWSWYASAVDSGVYEYYENCSDMALMKETADALKEYGCEQFSNAYLRGAQVLIPLIKSSGSDMVNNEEIMSFSRKMADYLDEYEFEICETIKDYLLDNYDMICEYEGVEISDMNEGSEEIADIFDILSQRELDED